MLLKLFTLFGFSSNDVFALSLTHTHTCTCPLLCLWLRLRGGHGLPADSGVDIQLGFNYKAFLKEIVEILNR